jgi:hypothetical protein
MLRPLDTSALQTTIFLSAEFFKDLSYERESSCCARPIGSHLKPYTIISHVEQRLSDESSDLDRVEYIYNINRAIEFRIARLRSVFALDELRVGKQERYIEILARLGLVRPLVLNEIRKLRNAVTHREDAAAPSLDTVKLYLDVAWYFLRSTDWVFSYIEVDYSFERYDESSKTSRYHGVLKMSPHANWRIELHSSIPTAMLSLKHAQDHFTLRTAKSIPALKDTLTDRTRTVELSGVLWDDAVKNYFGKLYFEWAAEFL